MAFFNKVGNLIKQTVSKHVSSEISVTSPSLFQAIRCMSSSSKIFVGGLSWSTDEMSLKEAFSQYGDVVEARVILDRDTGRSRGFGFVTFTSTEAASSAIQAFDGQDLHGRRIRVNYATERPRGGGFGGSFGGGGGGGGFNYGGQGGNYGGGGYQQGSFGGSGSNYPGGGNYGGGYGGSTQYPSGGFGGSSYGGGSGDSVQGSGNYGGSDDINIPGDGSDLSNTLNDLGRTNSESQAPIDAGEIGINTPTEDFGQNLPDGNDRDDNDEPNDHPNIKS